MKTMQSMQKNKSKNVVLKSDKEIKNFSAYYIEDLIQIYSNDKFNFCMFFLFQYIILKDEILRLSSSEGYISQYTP